MKKAVDHGERAHALLSPSGASRWINCTASPRLEEHFQQETSSFAEEGTLAHEMAEIMLKVDLKRLSFNEYKQLLEVLKTNKHYTDDMPDEVLKYVKYVKQQFKEAQRQDPKAMLLIEEKLDLTDYIEEGFGTSDIIIIYNGFIEVIDLKYGKGVRVYAEHNSQLKTYGLGALLVAQMFCDIHTVKLTIVQPRLDNISSWEIPAKFLLLWGDDVLKPKAKEAFKGGGDPVAGDWCQFCKAKPKCRALYDHAMAVAKQDFDIILDPRLLNDKELFEAYLKSGFIKNWLDAVSSLVFDEALKGKQWPDHKLVEGRSVRSWKNEAGAIDALEQELFDVNQIVNTKIKGIGEIEKLVGAKNFHSILGKFVEKPRGAPTLVHKSDKRDIYGLGQAKKAFAQAIEEDEEDLS